MRPDGYGRSPDSSPGSGAPSHRVVCIFGCFQHDRLAASDRRSVDLSPDAFAGQHRPCHADRIKCTTESSICHVVFLEFGLRRGTEPPIPYGDSPNASSAASLGVRHLAAFNPRGEQAAWTPLSSAIRISRVESHYTKKHAHLNNIQIQHTHGDARV